MADAAREDRSQTLRFPTDWGRIEPWRVAGVRGQRFGLTTPAQDELFAEWVARGDAAPHEELKANVFRAGELCAKFFPAPTLFRRLTNRDTAHRAARLALAIAPHSTPRPLLAVAGVGPGAQRSLLITEFVPGVTLTEAWDTDPRAREALPGFLAALHDHGVHHGDLHPANLLWDGTQLSIIDVTALRRGLHLLFARRLAVAQWARLLIYLGDVEGVRTAHRAYVARSGTDDADAAWSGVLERARDLMRRRRTPLPGAPDLS